MSESGAPLDLEETVPPKRSPLGPILVVVAVVGLIILAIWISREKKNEAARKDAVSAMDKELGADEEAIKAEREKLMDLTKQVEELRAKIQMGAYKDGKAAVAQFNKLAADQRAEREKFTQMADAYNKKVEKYRQLDQ